MTEREPSDAQRERQEDYPQSEVPPSARKGLASLSVVLLGFTFFTATMFGGGSIGTAFPFYPDLVGIMIVGNLLLGAYVGALGLIACRTGLNTALLSRFGFGELGSKIPDLLLGATQIGWYGWGTATLAVVLLRLSGVEEGAALHDPLLYASMVLFGAAFCWTAYIGYRGLEVLSIVAVPAMMILLLVSLGTALSDAGGWQGLGEIAPTTSMSVGTAITIVFGTFVSGGTQATNWTRFAGSGTHAVGASLAAFFVGNGLMIVTGAIGALVYRQPDVVDVLVLQGLLVLGVAMLFLNIWTTQDNTIYNFSTVGCNALRTSNRRLVTLGGAAIGTVLAVLRIDLYLVPFLLLLGTFIPPIGGVIMADYFYKHRGSYPTLVTARIQPFNLAGLAGYAIGCAVAWLSPGIPPINGIAAAVLGYVVVDRLVNRQVATST